jgi:ATP-binding cassette subfamily B protein
MPDGTLDKAIDGTVEFNKVSFTYQDTNIRALNNISFSINAGESLAIIGKTGSGKSTIANLLARLFDATEGEIKIDNIPIHQFNMHSLRVQMGYVPQDVFLFSDTIYNNIAFGLTQPDEKKIIKAAHDADVYNNIMSFANGFETRIGERGITLSGGQKQRVSIARAIVREPKILVLDDVLSAVDTKTENTILSSLKQLMQNRTTIIISHRVSSAKLANKIIVLDDGCIMEEGTHESLMAQRGIYHELYDKQTQDDNKVAVENK